MSVVCSCPAATALTSIPGLTCGENFGQIQKLAFQRIYSTGSTRNTMTETSIKTLSDWQTLMAAADGTKVVVTPYVEAPTQEGGDPITYGGGNETLGGAEEIVGRGASTITFALRKYPQDIIKALKALQCETQLGVWLFNEHGQIEGTLVSGTPGTDGVYAPIPIRSLFVGDKIHGGLEEPDNNSLQFAFLPNYSDDLVIVTPSFNPLLAL